MSRIIEGGGINNLIAFYLKDLPFALFGILVGLT